MDSRKQRKILIINLAIAVFLFSAVLYVIDVTGATGVTYKELGDGIDLFKGVYKHVLQDYVKEVDPGEISQDAVEGIFKHLDPYSSYLPPKDFSQLQEEAKGEFGGLGIEIATVNDYPRIMSYPIPNSPAEHAGLRAGDEIILINGESTKGLSINDVVAKLRGEVGTQVNITIQRSHQDDPLTMTLKREKISLKNIYYSGEIQDGIGYIKLVRFNQEASHELDEAIRSVLKIKNLKGVILDLRSNPGGLLIAAQDVANKFLPKKSLIVFTRGRTADSKEEFFANAPPLLPNTPFVVLINRGSASASEIVAGAIQDQDRGVLVGETSFGKGLVQKIYFDELPRGAGIKLTTSYYYTPSGRCINNEKNFMMEENEELSENETAPKLPSGADSLNTHEKFYTLNKERVVYGGGGITPDIIVTEKTMGNIVIQLVAQSAFLDFAVEYVGKHPELTENFAVTGQLINEFKEFIANEKVFKYSIPGKTNLDNFKKIINRESYNGDVTGMIENLEKSLMAKRDKDFESNLENIKRILKREIISAKFGSTARTVASKEWDIQLQKAIEILNTPEKYNAVLAKGAKTGVVE